MPDRPKPARVGPNSSGGKAYDRLRRGSSPALSTAKAIRNSRRWRALRSQYTGRLCCDPFETHQRAGRAVVMDELHHIIGLARDPALAFEHSNLAPLCSACHAQVEAMEAAGETTSRLFTPTQGGQDF